MGWSYRGRHWVLLVCGVTIGGCAGSSDATDAADPATAEQPELPGGHPDISDQAAPAAPAQVVSGTVLETMDGGGYTYALARIGEDEVWLAGPETELAEGGTVTITDPMPMQNFASPSLERTFDVIYFVNGFSASESAPASMPSIPSTPGSNTGVVLQAMNAGGYTYVEVQAGEAAIWLAGPQTPMAEGDSITWSDGSVMYNFASPSLDRTFEEILFVGGFTVVR